MVKNGIHLDEEQLLELYRLGLDVDAYLAANGITPQQYTITTTYYHEDNLEEERRMAKQRQIDKEKADRLSGQMLHAIIIEDYEGMENLVKQGADPNYLYVEGEASQIRTAYTPIIYAIKYCRYEAIDVLVKLGADADFMPDKLRGKDYFRPALHAAMETRDIELLDKLLSYGANINNVDSHGNTVLIKFANQLSKPIMDALIAMGIDVNHQNDNGRAAIHEAVVLDNVVLARYLVNKNCNIELKSRAGFTALYCAAELKKRELTRFLIESGADLHAETNGGDTPIKMLAKNDNVEAFQQIIELGLEIKPDAEGNLPFHVVATKNLLRYFLDDPEKFDVNAQNGEGNTPMMLMSFNREYADLFEKALDNGLDVTIKNNKGETIFDIAKKRNAKFMLALLEDRLMNKMIEKNEEMEFGGIHF